MNGDYLEILKNYKETLEEDIKEDIKADTMTTIEWANPKLSSQSKKYREGNKYIFKQYISYENAQSLIDIVTSVDKYSMKNLNEYKEKISTKCNLINIMGENPVEMLVYSVRALSNDVFINAVSDELKNYSDYDRDSLIEAYKNILLNWTWTDCIKLVLNSIQELALVELSQYVYKVFESNYMLRELAAYSLINIGTETYFESIVNFLAITTGESTEETLMARNILISLGKNTNVGSAYIYKVYLKLSVQNRIRNLLISGIRRNISKRLYDHMEKTLKNPNAERNIHNRIIFLLGRIKDGNKKCGEILHEALGYSYLDKAKIIEAIGSESFDMQLEIATSSKQSDKNRTNAIINIGKSDDEDTEDVLLKLYNKSDILRVAAASAFVERGKNNELLTLFKYLVGTKEESDICISATNQIKRLKSLGKESINTALTTVVAKFMESDDLKSKDRVLKILKLYSSGNPTKDICEIFIRKLQTTSHNEIKLELLKFFSKNFSEFNEDLKNNIKIEIGNCTTDKIIGKNAMECLKNITNGISALPKVGE